MPLIDRGAWVVQFLKVHDDLIQRDTARLHRVPLPKDAAVVRHTAGSVIRNCPGRKPYNLSGLPICARWPWEVAYQAIMRLQHGLAPNSRWIDPTAKDFDAEKIVKDFVEWQYEPFVSFVLYLKRQEMDQPYYQERLATLTRWAGSGVYRTLLDQEHESLDGQLIKIGRIQAFELAPEGETVDAYVIAGDGDEQVLRTVVAPAIRKAQWHGFRSTDRGANQPRAFVDGQALFFEIWDQNRISDTFIGGFVIYPDGRDAHEEVGGQADCGVHHQDAQGLE
jgi:hypothetical protein